MKDAFSQCVYALIPYGKKNAISLYDMSNKYGFDWDMLIDTDRAFCIRSCINELLFDGVLILTDGYGYYRPSKEDYREVWDFFLSINNPVLFQAMKKAVTEYMTALEKEDSHGH